MLYILYLLYYTHIPYNILNKAYYILVAELAEGRVCYGPSLYGPSLLWAEFVMGPVCYGPRCPVTAGRGPFIYQKDPKYRKDPEIPERPVNGSIHAQVSEGGRRFILILKKCLKEYIRIFVHSK